MSRITEIKGWITLDMFDPAHKTNQKGFAEAIQQLRCPHSTDSFATKYRCDLCRYPKDDYETAKYTHVPQMFSLIEDSGDKNPGYIMFAATINYADMDEIIEFIEMELLTRLSGFELYMVVRGEDQPVQIREYSGDRSEGGWTLHDQHDLDLSLVTDLKNTAEAPSEFYKEETQDAEWQCVKCSRSFGSGTALQTDRKCMFCGTNLKMIHETVRTKVPSIAVTFFKMARLLSRMIW